MEIQNTLGIRFKQAQSLYDKIVDGNAAQAEHDKVLEVVQACTLQVASLALFSNNEEADDITTGHLKYLLLPYIQAEVLARNLQLTPAVRRQLLQQAVSGYSRYLEQCEQYSLLAAHMQQQWQAIRDEPLAVQQQDPTSKRANKIARFKASKAAKDQLEALQERRRRHLPKYGAGDDESGLGDEGLQEEGEREAWMLQLQLAALTSLDQIASLQQELDLLQHAPDEGIHRHGNGRGLRQHSDDTGGAAAAAMQQLRIAAANLQQKPSRQSIAASVLGPSHNLPTRSIEQQAEIEMDRARKAQAAQREAAPAQAQHDSSDEENDNAWVMRQRAKDEWKDDHPTGWGNSKLRPTA